jgi:formiminotetrahydrofolate cyclodeaminase
MSLVHKTVTDFNNELASTSPAPGGGSVSALAGSMGTALISMVCQLTIGKKKYASVEEEMKKIHEHSESLRSRITELIDKDTDAFNMVMAAFALPKATEDEKTKRDAAIETATKEATLIPLEVMKVCREAIGLSLIVATKGNTNALSDAGVSALMLKSGCRGAYYNVKINLASLKDSNFTSDIDRQAKALLADTDKTADDVFKHVESSWT